MENFYQKYENCHTYLKEYFDDAEFDKKDFAYHYIYLPFIKKYLPYIIKREIVFFKEDEFEKVNTNKISIPIAFEVENEITTYTIEDDSFVISMWHYNEALNMIKNFLNFYNLNPKEMTLKELINAYYMELQRIEYDTEHREIFDNYYDEIRDKINQNEIATINAEEIFEDIFLKEFIPGIVNNKINSIENDSNWEFMGVIFEVKAGDNNSIDDNVLTIDKKYYNNVSLLIKSFINGYELKGTKSGNPLDNEIYISSLKKLVDAYYMELQRIDYLKESNEKSRN